MNVDQELIMSECTNVEHPFLEQFRETGWQVIVNGSGGGEGFGGIWEDQEGAAGEIAQQVMNTIRL